MAQRRNVYKSRKYKNFAKSKEVHMKALRNLKLEAIKNNNVKPVSSSNSVSCDENKCSSSTVIDNNIDASIPSSVSCVDSVPSILQSLLQTMLLLSITM